jgi:sigma-B regulation protein RsbU (phosphoserine phosphatase)
VHGRITFGPIYQPSLEVGGDFFDFISFSEGSVGLVIADVVGKGVPGALMMASVRSALRAHAHSIYDINEIVGQVNRLLFQDTAVSEFATLFYGVFSAKGDRFTYCNAGHNPPLLLRGEKFSELTAGGMVIGVSAEEKYDKDLLELRSGDILTFYTDGVTEARDFDGNIYGTARLRNSILHHRQLEAPTLANQLHWDVRRYAGLAHQDDDITIVVAKVG